MLRKQVEEIEQLNQSNEIRKFYAAMSKIRKGFQPKDNKCKDKYGKILFEDKQIEEKWTEYFKNLYNKHNDPDNSR